MALATSYKTIVEIGEKRLELPHGEYLVGRSRDCAIRLDDPYVSRVHLRLQVTPDGVSVEDVGSKNPARINGQLLRVASFLADGDEITIGSARLRVRLQPAASSMYFEEDTITLTGKGFGPILDELRMAACPNCDAVITDGEDAEVCPHCGHPLQRRLTQELPMLDVE